MREKRPIERAIRMLGGVESAAQKLEVKEDTINQYLAGRSPSRKVAGRIQQHTKNKITAEDLISSTIVEVERAIEIAGGPTLLANGAGVNRSTVISWINGTRRPAAVAAYRIAKFTGDAVSIKKLRGCE